MVIPDVQLWELYFTVKQSSRRMILIMIVELVELRLLSSWNILKEVWYLLHYIEVALKLGR